MNPESTSKYKWLGRIFRNVATQPGGPGTSPVPVETDIVKLVHFSWEVVSGREKWMDATFTGERHLKLSFMCPGFDVDIIPGDIAEITYGTRPTKQYVIVLCEEPNEIGDEWCVRCYRDTEGNPC